jgi:tetratricopeptide (TPR) repeat protein
MEAFAASVLVPLAQSALHKVAVIVLVFLSVFAVWRLTNRLPKTKRRKFGFVVCLATSDESERSRLEEDFITNLRELLARGATRQAFQVLVIPNHRANGVVGPQDAIDLMRRCRARFMVYGRARLRTVDDKPQHVIHLEGVVVHEPIPLVIQQTFAREFRELLPKDLTIACENDVFTFAFTAEMVSLVAKYIIGVASALSWNLDYAEQLYNETLRALTGCDSPNPVHEKLRQRLPLRLGELHLVRANMAYGKWTKSRGQGDMVEVAAQLDQIPHAMLSDYSYMQLRAITQFVLTRDVAVAIATLKPCEGRQDGLWLYNLGFLHAYQGDLKRAVRMYREAFKLPLRDPSILAQTEQFMFWLLDQEPDRYQLYYCLGFINWQVKEDVASAVGYFERFLEAGSESEFPKERQLTREWLEKLKQHSSGDGQAD